MIKNLSLCILTLAACMFVACSSTNTVLEELDNPNEEGAENLGSSAYKRLQSTLETRGYQAVGLQFESDSTLTLLNRVFENERTWDRKLKRVYTGLSMAYDKKYESLTIGAGLKELTIVKYIEKHVPKK